MAPLRSWFRPPRHVLTIFLAVAVVSAAALIFLVRLLFEQDMSVELQRRQERLEQSAERVSAAMKEALTDLERRLAAAGAFGDPPVGIVILDIKGAALAEHPAGGLLYVPELPQSAPVRDSQLSEAEQVEFGARNPAAAAVLYARLATDAPPEVRPVALNRLARASRKAGNLDAALSAYDKIGNLSDIRVEGLPSGLLAHAGRASLLEAAGRTSDLAREATGLSESLRAGRWRLTKSEYEYYSGLADGWLEAAGAPAAPADSEVLARTEAALRLWLDKPWTRLRAGETAAAQVIQVGEQPVLAVWAANDGGARAAIATRSYVAPICRAALIGAAFDCALTDAERRKIAGDSAPFRFAAMSTPNAGLPWGLQVFPTDGGGPAASPRRSLLLWLLAVVAAVWIAGAAFLARALTGELRVARLQSDFVASVSHEFRSPLSSIGQISEMLVSDRLDTDELRRRSYGVLARESSRLRVLVEGLLEFGRLEAGHATYRFEPIEIGAFVETLTYEFGERVGAAGYHVELSRPEAPLTIRADREALGRALFNLLDNAVKYSPECHTVWVDLEPLDDCVAIAVRDRGLGIPAAEQSEIFERFVRGSNSRERRIKGTGIGLAMARHIAQAHGGEIRLASKPGEGSRFTLVLPQMS